MEIRLAIMKVRRNWWEKSRAHPDNLTSREKTTLIKDISETLGVNAESLLKEVGIARSTYYYQLEGHAPAGQEREPPVPGARGV